MHCDSAATGPEGQKPGDVELGGTAAKASREPELATHVKPAGAEAGSGL